MTEDSDRLQKSLQYVAQEITAARKILIEESSIMKRPDGDFLIIPLHRATPLRAHLFAADIHTDTATKALKAFQPSLF